MSEVFDLEDTCIKYLGLNLWLGPRRDEGTYRVKVSIHSVNLSKDSSY
jgi:hypothetical protein